MSLLAPGAKDLDSPIAAFLRRKGAAAKQALFRRCVEQREKPLRWVTAGFLNSDASVRSPSGENVKCPIFSFGSTAWFA
jgi:hypothetical protein